MKTFNLVGSWHKGLGFFHTKYPRYELLRFVKKKKKTDRERKGENARNEQFLFPLLPFFFFFS